uniref:Uncharacterized protein n=1 Tax=Salvator merianae TaxID=96440 RepID=A0A8D0DLG2_SALMN
MLQWLETGYPAYNRAKIFTIKLFGKWSTGDVQDFFAGLHCCERDYSIVISELIHVLTREMSLQALVDAIIDIRPCEDSASVKSFVFFNNYADAEQPLLSSLKLSPPHCYGRSTACSLCRTLAPCQAWLSVWVPSPLTRQRGGERNGAITCLRNGYLCPSLSLLCFVSLPPSPQLSSSTPPAQVICQSQQLLFSCPGGRNLSCSGREEESRAPVDSSIRRLELPFLMGEFVCLCVCVRESE